MHVRACMRAHTVHVIRRCMIGARGGKSDVHTVKITAMDLRFLWRICTGLNLCIYFPILLCK